MNENLRESGTVERPSGGGVYSLPPLEPRYFEQIILKTLTNTQREHALPKKDRPRRLFPSGQRQRGQPADPGSLIRRTRHIERNYPTVINFANCRGPRSLARPRERTMGVGTRGMA